MESITLLQLGEQVKNAVKSAFLEPVWVRAEVSELRENANGHCYLELVEKDASTDIPVAKQKATIWAFTYRMLKPYFEASAGTPLAVGMKILVSCQVEFHEIYGISLNIRDIDPAFTAGEMAVRRAEIIRRLTDEGVVEMNKLVEMPLVPQHVAVVSSATAAGFGDFCDQLRGNAFGYKFGVKLFPALMQGAQTEQSVIAALDKIYDEMAHFDVVVIIRGGGAVSDLAAFDNYNLALHCAQFPLPIISGIGHQRDESIIDLVAHTSVKTPTAAAEFLIAQVHEFEEFIDDLAQRCSLLSRDVVAQHQHRLLLALSRLTQARQITAREMGRLQTSMSRMELALKTAISSEKNRLSIVAKTVEIADPERMLQHGYSLTTKRGKIVRSAQSVSSGDVLETHFADGTVRSVAE